MRVGRFLSSQPFTSLSASAPRTTVGELSIGDLSSVIVQPTEESIPGIESELSPPLAKGRAELGVRELLMALAIPIKRTRPRINTKALPRERFSCSWAAAVRVAAWRAATGVPQFGQVGASAATSRPHSGHLTSAMITSRQGIPLCGTHPQCDPSGAGTAQWSVAELRLGGPVDIWPKTSLGKNPFPAPRPAGNAFSPRASELIMPGSRVRVPPLLCPPKRWPFLWSRPSAGVLPLLLITRSLGLLWLRCFLALRK